MMRRQALQLESRNDLVFVFDGLKAALQTHLAANPVNPTVVAGVEAQLEQLFANTAANCTVQGHPFDNLSAQAVSIEEYEPVDAKLMDEWNTQQLEMDAALLDLMQELRLSQPLLERNASNWVNQITSSTMTTSTGEDTHEIDALPLLDAGENSTGSNFDERLVESMSHAMRSLKQLVSDVPSLTAKMTRYETYLKDELSDDAYRKHIQRLTSPHTAACAVENSVVGSTAASFEEGMERYIDQCYARAIKF